MSASKYKYKLISEKNTFLVPITDQSLEALPETLSIEGIEFSKKPEFHVTVISFPGGKKLGEFFKDDVLLKDRIIELINQFDWSDYFLDDEKYRIAKDKQFFTLQGDGKDKKKVWQIVHAESIIQKVTLPYITEFYRRLKEELGVNLGEVPPVHVTLYTHGDSMGIAIHSAEDFVSLNPRKIEL